MTQETNSSNTISGNLEDDDQGEDDDDDDDDFFNRPLPGKSVGSLKGAYWCDCTPQLNNQTLKSVRLGQIPHFSET